MPKLNNYERYTSNKIKTYLAKTYNIDKKDIKELSDSVLNPKTYVMETYITIMYAKDGKSFGIYSVIPAREPYKLLYFQLWNYINGDKFKQEMKEEGFDAQT